MAAVEELYAAAGVIHGDGCRVCVQQPYMPYGYPKMVDWSKAKPFFLKGDMIKSDGFSVLETKPPIKMYYQQINGWKHPIKRYKQKRWLKRLLATPPMPTLYKQEYPE